VRVKLQGHAYQRGSGTTHTIAGTVEVQQDSQGGELYHAAGTIEQAAGERSSSSTKEDAATIGSANFVLDISPLLTTMISALKLYPIPRSNARHTYDICIQLSNLKSH
jgi:hypothetical protein